ncbi:MAG: DUF434 domain-containing protein [Thermodesulforhabdaceae bacterium]
MSKETSLRKELILAASFDFYFLQSHDYPRDRSLELVGNRYGLTVRERNVLRRGVFGHRDALTRRGKRTTITELENRSLTVDGHNVHITVESAIIERVIIKGNDGALRDIAEISSGFRLTELSLFAAEIICKFLAGLNINEVAIYFDAPISMSGELAKIYRELFRKYKIKGTAQVVSVPEKQFSYEKTVIASSDSAVIDRSNAWLDLAFLAINTEKYLIPFMDFSFLSKLWQIPDFS